MLSVKTGKNLHLACSFAHVFHHLVRTFQMSLLGAAWFKKIFDTLSRWDQNADMYQRSVMKLIVQFLTRTVSRDSEN